MVDKEADQQSTKIDLNEPPIAALASVESGRFRRARKIPYAATALLILAIVPLFVVFAQSQIKDVFDQFTSGCTFVIAQTDIGEGQVQVRGWMSGTAPKSIPLLFMGKKAAINTIEYVMPDSQGSDAGPSNLSLHPATNLTCPGHLCPEAPAGVIRESALISLMDIHKEFNYIFHVRLRSLDPKIKVNSTNLQTYGFFAAGAEATCRVESKAWFNFWVWGSPLCKLLVFVVMVVIGGLLVGLANWIDQGGEKA